MREVARRVPLERILIETDAPYLAPAPHRGKPNSPHLFPLIAAVLADIHGNDVASICRRCAGNYQRLFNVPFANFEQSFYLLSCQ
nr:TatD family hydrolase [Chromatium okenii]